MAGTLTDAERLKFALLADGLTISTAARDMLNESNSGRPLTPADYASTSGIILELDDSVWVNAPIGEHNPNFVEHSPHLLDIAEEGLFVRSGALASHARVWVPPSYHGTIGSNGMPLNNYAFTHADRVRISPIMGCAMTCKFCNIPFEDRYGTKPMEAIVEAARIALEDPIQPARHILISGGTPHPRDIEFLRRVYETVLDTFTGIDVDIMMVPVAGLFDLPHLDALGLHQLSINIELFGTSIAPHMMRQKFGRGLEWYLSFLEEASSALGPGRVRSMLIVGLEPLEDTLAGVAAILERGCVPVLSPFRPSPATPLRDVAPPNAETLENTYLRALDLTIAADSTLGPDCAPCSHNALTFVPESPANAHRHAALRMI